MILLVNSGGKKAVEEWRHLFASTAPHLRVHYLHDDAVRPEDVSYVFCWAPPRGLLAGFPNLRMILSSGAGVDHITADPTVPEHLPIVRMGGEETGQRMGEYVCLAALSILRQRPRMLANQRQRRWEHFENPRTAADVTVGIMGMGNLGVRSAEMLRGLGFPVRGWSRTRKILPGVECYAGAAERDAFLAGCDVLVNLLPDTAETKGAIDAETIARLPAGAAIVNVGRGPQLVMDDLLAALDAGHLQAAILDVFETEPLPADHPAWTHPKVIVTPQIGAMASRPARARYIADAIAAHERGDLSPNLFDLSRGY